MEKGTADKISAMPADNEETYIYNGVQNTRKALDRMNCDHEIIVVGDLMAFLYLDLIFTPKKRPREPFRPNLC